ncbi:MAG: hypothetical protein JXA11_08735 [Phycisphaerae bacterium]|nr:hypothetical protein [Phycisphaerae bacterium]
MTERAERKRDNPFIPQPTLTESQIKKVHQAVAAYTNKYDRRPGTLEALVNEGLLTPKDLFSTDREDIPAIDKSTSRFTVTPDVIYFPALKPTDPADGVLLCTVLLKDEDDPFLVIYNDGRFSALKSRELIEALNRTYEHIGAACIPNRPISLRQDRVIPNLN